MFDKEHDGGLRYQLDLKITALRDLCHIWQTKVRPIPSAYPVPDCWGPSPADIQEAAAAATHGSWDSREEDTDIVLEDQPSAYHANHDESDYESENEGDLSDYEDLELDADSELVKEIELMLWRDANCPSDDLTDYSSAWGVNSDDVPSVSMGQKRLRTCYE